MVAGCHERPPVCVLNGVGGYENAEKKFSGQFVLGLGRIFKTGLGPFNFLNKKGQPKQAHNWGLQANPSKLAQVIKLDLFGYAG